MKKLYLVSVNARRAHEASRLHWLELEYVKGVLKDCEALYGDLKRWLRESKSELEDDMLWEDYRSDIEMELWRADMRGCSRESLAKIESWLLY